MRYERYESCHSTDPAAAPRKAAAGEAVNVAVLGVGEGESAVDLVERRDPTLPGGEPSRCGIVPIRLDAQRALVSTCVEYARRTMPSRISRLRLNNGRLRP